MSSAEFPHLHDSLSDQEYADIVMQDALALFICQKTGVVNLEVANSDVNVSMACLETMEMSDQVIGDAFVGRLERAQFDRAIREEHDL